MRRDHGRRHRRRPNAAAAGGPDAVCRDDAALPGVGRVGEGSWWVYAILFLAPDLSFAGCLGGPRVGAVVYNAAHSYMAPVTLMVTGFGLASPLVLSIALIWMAHIGIDRALGYGLKYSAGFTFTHLGRIGRLPGLN